MSSLPLSTIACLIVLLIASITDVLTKKILNILTFPAAICAISIHFFLEGTDGLITSCEGWLVGVLVLLLTKICLRQLGFGDVKLIAAVGAFLGPKLVLLVCFYFSLCFGALSLFLIFRVLPWQQLLTYLIVKRIAGKKAVAPVIDFDKVNKVRKSMVPLAPIITAGTILALILEKPTLQFFGFGS